ALRPGEWEYIAFTWDGNTRVFTLYQNGVQVARSTTSITRLPYNYFNLEINVGRDPQTGSDYLTGYIDEIAVYKRALTDSEIRAHYAMGKPN
ncbi:MAG TPA: LamG domain-containing protein, partial [bacterium]|nr:LamG domain-containing protein [bacterium]